MNTVQPNLMTARGFSLLEVLIAILILSIGLLGLASLQSNGMRFNHTSYLRSQATVLSYGIADTMRANRGLIGSTTGALGGAYDTTFAQNAAFFTGSSVAQTDLNGWKTQLETLLPGGEGLISRVGGEFLISVKWTERSDPNPTIFTLVTVI